MTQSIMDHPGAGERDEGINFDNIEGRFAGLGFGQSLNSLVPEYCLA